MQQVRDQTFHLRWPYFNYISDRRRCSFLSVDARWQTKKMSEFYKQLNVETDLFRLLEAALGWFQV